MESLAYKLLPWNPNPDRDDPPKDDSISRVCFVVIIQGRVVVFLFFGARLPRK
jgi:hypothetical protein